MLLPQTAAFVDRLVAEAQAYGQAPALVLAVFRDGVVRHISAAGAATAPCADLQYRIGSITKTFTAVLMMRLRDEGHLALDDLLYRHLPGTPVGSVTLRQLLGHCAGLQREPDGPWWERHAGPDLDQFLDALGPDKVSYPPLRGHHYSNLAYGLLGAVIARATGEQWADALSKRVLEPLSMRRTSHAPRTPFTPGYVVHPWHGTLRQEPRHDLGAMAPAGQLWSTAADLARWGAFLATPDPAVLAAATLDEMCAPVAMRDLDAWTNGHGLGLELWRHGERVLVGHSGSMPGYLSLLAVHRPSRTGVVALTNTYTLRGATIADLGLRVLAEVCDREPVPAEAWRPAPPPPARFIPLTGRWWWMGREHEARWDATANELLVGPVGGAPWRFVPETAERWRGRGGANDGEVLRVLRDAAGGVAALDIATMILIRDPDGPADDHDAATGPA